MFHGFKFPINQPRKQQNKFQESKEMGPVEYVDCETNLSCRDGIDTCGVQRNVCSKFISFLKEKGWVPFAKGSIFRFHVDFGGVIHTYLYLVSQSDH